MIHVEEHKDPQQNLKSESFLLPKKLYLPISQHVGAPSKLLVKKGDEVNEGDMIADVNGFVSAALHAPASGKITEIKTISHPSLKQSQGIVLNCQHQQKQDSPRKNIEELTSEQLIEIVKNSGIVGMGGAAFPTHVKLKPPKEISTLIINGCECEPYLACDCRLMIEKIKEIFAGIDIIRKLINPKEIIFAVENNKPEAIKKINLAISTKKIGLSNVRLAIVESAYPQGGEKQLIKAVTAKEVPPAGLPFDVGCLVFNVATCFAIYEAVHFSKPLIERLVSFAGDALVKPKNVWIKIGTTLKELFDSKVLEFKVSPKVIVSGGPMMGVALTGLNFPILKGTGGFLFLANTSKVDESVCLKCARCVDVCSMNLLPLEYSKLVKNNEFDSLDDFNINDCIECGCCAYSCPAKIPIVHYIKVGKACKPKK
ncbi:MAG: electron transport complex subunit RsxC [Candidatus Omnitrophica bacterium]|nr:electron transport complex subunit RsxC [Candidatus Omnitrophota bacterium]